MRYPWSAGALTAASALTAAGVLAIGLVAGYPPAAASATRAPAPPSASASASAKAGAVAVTEVTLVTGDRVRLVTRPGAPASATVERQYARPGISYLERTIPGPGGQPDLLVIPSDAAGLIVSGVADTRLFDVSELARDGYTATSALPLIVGYPGGAAPALAPALRPAAALTRSLPSIGGAAVSVPPAGESRFWSSLTTPVSGAAHRLALTPQVAKVWLDARVRAIGGPAPAGTPTAARPTSEAAPATTAPKATRPKGTKPKGTAADPGAGILVADLDTGYDQGHPDLQGVVTAAQDFTGSPNGVQDVHGHGTWTASIIAGSGAASGGSRRGVAPGARLLIGKVLGDDGSGPESQVIAGMQWAVSQHAKIVNMSLGSFTDCDPGTDPISQALDSLSASSGTLFVVAAGNDGPSANGDIGEPGSASSALTVGAVDNSGSLAFFSSTGPRCLDDAVKPDLTAPGVGIAGARAAGTSLGQGNGIDGDGPIDDSYTRASGTSGSTPIATGSAAVLAQEHPGWDGSQLKAALMSSADPAPGASPYQQGTGQLDLTRATAAPAYANPGSLSALLKSPSPQSLTVSYHNDGDAPLTLSLSLAMTGQNGSPAPAGLFTASPSTVTVPAGGDARATVDITPASGPAGLYSGVLTAASSDGATVLRTAVGVASKAATITFTGIDRNGQTISDNNNDVLFPVLVNLDTGQTSILFFSSGTVAATVPQGRYEVTTELFTVTAADPVGNVTIVEDPEITVSGDMTYVADARRGVKATVTVDRPVGDPVDTALLGETVAGSPASFGAQVFGQDLFVTPTARVKDRPFDFVLLSQRDDSDPHGGNFISTVAYSLAFQTSGQIPGLLTHQVHDGELAVIHRTYRQQGVPGSNSEELDELTSTTGALLGLADTLFFPPAGGKITELVSPGSWQTLSEPSSSYEEDGPVTSYAAGQSYSDDWGSAALGNASATTRLGDVISPDIRPDAGSGPQHLYSVFSLDGQTGTLTLRRGNIVVGTESIFDQQPFNVPAGLASYTLSASYQRNVPWSTLGTEADASWTFGSGHVPGGTAAALPLWDIRFRGAFDFLDQAPAGRPFSLTVAPDLQGAPNLPPGTSTAPITAIGARASFDDGKTWQPLTLNPSDPGTWTTTVTPPPGTTFVSLSANLTDAAGNRTQQTVIRAYQVAAPAQ